MGAIAAMDIILHPFLFLPLRFQKTPRFLQKTVLRGKPLGSRSEGCKHPWVKMASGQRLFGPQDAAEFGPLGWKDYGDSGMSWRFHGLPKHTKKTRKHK